MAAPPTLKPASTTPTNILPETGVTATAQAVASYPYGIYADSGGALYDANFVLGAIDQVNYTYRKLGGDVLDIELTEKNVYAAYEEAVLEYSYIVNVHQAKNTLPYALGKSTGSFDHDGLITEGPSDVSLKFPKFDYGYERRVMDQAGTEANVGGTQPIYSASFDTKKQVMDYDLQSIVQTSSSLDTVDFYNKVNNKRIIIKRVFYKTPHAMWRFYGYYGGLNTVGNLSTYGMYADDSTFEVIPAWQNKLQAMAYEDAIYTRNSHYSYELKNNKIRIYPQPTDFSPKKIWFQFTVEEDPWDDQADRKSGTSGVNNMNTLPFANIPYKSINSIGKQWIRRFALALTKEMLGQVRGKFGSIPIPGNEIQMNASDLLGQAKEEQEKLREELKTVLDEMTYTKVAETKTSIAKAVNETIATSVPMGIFQG